ncbi:hypothetical protein OG394_13885 [Kribbella sp. NBC_01245]|uniref:hypothetical protein n=1 Tax=Kribbella sp. NBC_01245 TaxID=2903578 RepID=UPI002E2962C8|nr:hypothetical protein [Kribbella sp. NBC_01245]
MANAYRDALLTGDRELGKENVILRALVAASAADMSQWVRTRLPEGDSVAEPIDKLLPDLQQADHLGKGMAATRKKLLSEAVAAVWAAILGGGWPLWLTSLIAAIGGVFAFSERAGETFGAVIIPVIAAGGGAVLAFVRVIQHSPTAVTAISGSAGKLWDSVDQIGGRAERLFNQRVQPGISTLYHLVDQTPGPTPVLRELRGTAKSIVGTLYVLLAVCLVFFGLGVANAANDYFKQSQCYGTTCVPG